MRKTKHGMTGTRLHKEWLKMHDRCSKYYCNKKCYMERGISVCEEWQEFPSFMKWAKNNGYSDVLTLDRIDNNKGYSPDNCRWITNKEQQNNRTNNVRIEYLGMNKTLAEWAEYYGLIYNTIWGRYSKGKRPPELFAQVLK